MKLQCVLCALHPYRLAVTQPTQAPMCKECYARFGKADQQRHAIEESGASVIEAAIAARGHGSPISWLDSAVDALLKVREENPRG